VGTVGRRGAATGEDGPAAKAGVVVTGADTDHGRIGDGVVNAIRADFGFGI